MAAPETAATAAVATDLAIKTSKAVVIMDHVRNNRIEYLVLLAISTMLGWTAEATTYVQGVCA
jgi:hypothetical protein